MVDCFAGDQQTHHRWPGCHDLAAESWTRPSADSFELRKVTFDDPQEELLRTQFAVTKFSFVWAEEEMEMLKWKASNGKERLDETKISKSLG